MRRSWIAVVCVVAWGSLVSSVASAADAPAADTATAAIAAHSPTLPSADPQTDTAPPRAATVPAARRGRWGGSVGVRTQGIAATYDFTNSPTPKFASTIKAPYLNATIALDHDYVGKFFSGGYRGPIRRGSRVGFGIEMQLAGAGDDLPRREVQSASSNGTPVIFALDQGGIIDAITLSAGGHVSYNLAPAISVWGGAKVSSLRIKSQGGSYQLPGSALAWYDHEEADIFWQKNVTPWAGAEVFLGNHLSLDLQAEMLPADAKVVETTPVALTFARKRNSMVAALRVFF